MTIIDDLIAAIQASQQERRKFVNMVKQATQIIDQEDADTKQQQFDADMVIANNWWDTTIKPTLTWDISQTLIIQRENILVDYLTIKGLLTTETDQFRLRVVQNKLKQAEDKFKQIKASL